MKRLPLLSAFELKGRQDLVSVYDHAIVDFLLWGFGGVPGAFENVIFCVKVREVHGGRYSPYLASQQAPLSLHFIPFLLVHSIHILDHPLKHVSSRRPRFQSVWTFWELIYLVLRSASQRPSITRGKCSISRDCDRLSPHPAKLPVQAEKDRCSLDFMLILWRCHTHTHTRLI